MSDRDRQNSIGLLVLAGIGAGALTGALLGLLAVRRPPSARRDEMTDTVDDLKRRAEQILSELSQGTSPVSRSQHKQDILEGDRIEPYDE